MEVHWKTCLLSESTVLWLQFFYKYFIVLVVSKNCYYCRYFNAFPNAAILKCKLQLITAIWNTGKWTQILQGKAVQSTFKHTLFLLKRETVLLAAIIGKFDNFMIVIWWQGENWQGEKLAGWEIGRVRNLHYFTNIGPHDLEIHLWHSWLGLPLFSRLKHLLTPSCK